MILAVLGALATLPSVPLFAAPTPVEELAALRTHLGVSARLVVKRDDAISFGWGGNKVRKICLVAADALAQQADTLITGGGVQSNHARVTAAAAAKLGLRSVLVANGQAPDPPTANALLARMFGADIIYVPTREARSLEMEAAAVRERAAGRRPYVIPIGASTPLGAAAFAMAVMELLEQMPAPDFIVHATSSGGTQAGLIAGCALAGVRTRVIGISADEPASELQAIIRRLLDGVATIVGAPNASRALNDARIEVDDRFIGDGYGKPTADSLAAASLLARTEALTLDQTYTAKAMAGLIGHARAGTFSGAETVLFWHTGGLPMVMSER